MDSDNSYFIKLFDDVLENDEDANLIFTDFIIYHGLSTLNTLLENMKYEKTNEIIKKACKICLDLLDEITKDMEKPPRVPLIDYDVITSKRNGRAYWVFLPITMVFLVGLKIVRCRKN